MAHLFFDLDRTLWHHERNHHVFFRELHAQKSWPGSSDQWAANYLAINDRLWDHIQDQNIDVDYVRARRFQLLFREMGLEFSSVREAKLEADRCEGILKGRLPDLGVGYDGVNEAFEWLHHLGHQLHVITNGVAAPQRRKVEALGLSDRIRVLMTSDVANCYKPSEGIFLAALKAAGASAGDSWMIGDSVLRDIRGGHGVGMRTAWFRAKDALSPDAHAKADLEFSDWRAFPELLEAALQRG